MKLLRWRGAWVVVVGIVAACREPTEPLYVVEFRTVAAGAFHSCGVTVNRAAFCWGSNSSGQLGIGSDRRLARRPQPAAASVRWASVSAGDAHTCGVTTEGALYCWGRNEFGQVGDGTRRERPVPTRVAGVFGAGRAHAVSVSAGRAHTCAVAEDGSGYCWGFNEDGELGDGTLEARTTPAPVAAGLRFLQVSAGGYHSCGLTASASLYCWGGRRNAELGIGSLFGSRFPVRTAPPELYVAVSAGWLYTCAVTGAGTGQCWGENGVGQLGDGTSVLRGNPTPVAGGIRFVAIVAGRGEYTCGVAGGGSVYCWGRNAAVRSVEGRAFASLRAAPLAGGLAFLSVALGVGHGCGVAADGIVYCWGLGSSGQLGDGAGEDRGEPVPAAGQTRAGGVAR
ncbi:MAG: hypothetical protein HY704_01735 [Gemmatimonadetes bacterium]|nr:hypothetical protein [Gemmatimonadota bacterium]